MPATTTVSRKSAMANMPNFIPLYSTKYPMISDSPSGVSKGMRLVAAMPAVRKIRKAIGWVTMPQAGIHWPKYSGSSGCPWAGDVLHVERSVDHHDPHDGGADGDLRRDHEGGGALPAEQR